MDTPPNISVKLFKIICLGFALISFALLFLASPTEQQQTIYITKKHTGTLCMPLPSSSLLRSGTGSASGCQKVLQYYLDSQDELFQTTRTIYQELETEKSYEVTFEERYQKKYITHFLYL